MGTYFVNQGKGTKRASIHKSVDKIIHFSLLVSGNTDCDFGIAYIGKKLNILYDKNSTETRYIIDHTTDNKIEIKGNFVITNLTHSLIPFELDPFDIEHVNALEVV